jgi:uncharacterized protein
MGGRLCRRRWPKAPRARTITLILAWVACQSAVASPIEDATAAMQQRDYLQAQRLLAPFAKELEARVQQGDTTAWDQLGVVKQLQHTVATLKWVQDVKVALDHGDYQTARQILVPRAEHGDPEAPAILGGMYQAGEGVPQDFREAIKWYRRGADRGSATAQHSLGLMYAGGIGIRQDLAESARWFRRAAIQGNAESQLLLGLSYAAGNGVPENYSTAYMWLNLSASRLSAGLFRDEAIRGRDAMLARMSPAQIREAQRLAREWQPVQEFKSNEAGPAP